MFKSRIRSRHNSHNILRTDLVKSPVRSIIRLGSTSIVDFNGKPFVEINSIQAVMNSSSKYLMKSCFSQVEVKTADWVIATEFNQNLISYPIVAKSFFGSRGKGNYLLHTEEDFNKWKENRDLTKYLIEAFKPYKLEYRLHIDSEGCFYTCRKALKNDIPKEQRWCMNDATCIWYLEESENFQKPNSWNDIVEECKKALNSLELDFCAFDVRVQSALDKKGNVREYQDYFLVEGNSAPSFSIITSQKYLENFPKIIQRKAIAQGLIK